VYADSGDQGIEKREQIEGKTAKFRVAMRPGKRRALPDTPEGRQEIFEETAKAHIRARVEHLFRLIKQQSRFWKAWLGAWPRSAERSMCWPHGPTCSCPAANCW
jgi:IS5 family transposase